jgi:hypothetical protein
MYDAAPVPALPPSAITPEERRALDALRRPPNLFQRFSRWLGLVVFFGAWQLLSVVILPRTYAWAAVCVVLAGVGSALVVRRRIDRLDMVAALKTRE